MTLSAKRPKKGQDPAEACKLNGIHREISALFETRAIGEFKSYWRDFAFGAAARQSDENLFRECYLRSEVMKRYQHGSVTAQERADDAIAGLLSDEEHNKLVTPRIVDAINRASTPKTIRDALSRARRIVHDILGPFSWERVYLNCEFSSGASTEHRRERSHVQLKWDSSTQVTAGALMPYLGWQVFVGEEMINPLQAPLMLVDGNGIFTVLKNFEKDRVCAKEPPLNMFLQKGYGSSIRPALNRRGLLRSDAKEYHMALAQRGSLDGSLATLDGKSASNSVTLALVSELFPAEHYDALCALRSPVGTLPDGRKVLWEMLSSMGNGFTFEIETLIFYALARAVCGMDAVVSVFGDDVVVPSNRAAAVVELFEFCGFRMNLDKSFVHGPFRESCGGHYFNGHDVTPFYIEELPNSLAEAVDLHNRVLQWAVRGGDLTPFWPLINAIRRAVPRAFRGPFGESGTLWSDWDQASPVFHRVKSLDRSSYACWTVKAYVKKVPIQLHDYLHGALLSSLWQGQPSHTSRQVRHQRVRDPRGRLSPHCQALLYRGEEERAASRGEITMARNGRWGVSKRYLRVSRQWNPVPVRDWGVHSER